MGDAADRFLDEAREQFRAGRLDEAMVKLERAVTANVAHAGARQMRDALRALLEWSRAVPAPAPVTTAARSNDFFEATMVQGSAPSNPRLAPVVEDTFNATMVQGSAPSNPRLAPIVEDAFNATMRQGSVPSNPRLAPVAEDTFNATMRQGSVGGAPVAVEQPAPRVIPASALVMPRMTTESETLPPRPQPGGFEVLRTNPGLGDTVGPARAPSNPRMDETQGPAPRPVAAGRTAAGNDWGALFEISGSAPASQDSVENALMQLDRGDALSALGALMECVVRGESLDRVHRILAEQAPRMEAACLDVLGAWNAVPVRSVGDLTGVGATGSMLLSLMDGRRTVAEVVATSGLARLHAAYVMVGLVQQGAAAVRR